MRPKVILDSNFLMLYPIFRGDIFEELDKIVGQRTEKIILTAVYDELRRISLEQGLKTRNQAEIVLRLIEKGEFRVIDMELKPSETVDELIARVSRKCKCFVATNDQELRKKLLKMRVPTVYLRQRNRLEIRGKL